MLEIEMNERIVRLTIIESCVISMKQMRISSRKWYRNYSWLR